MGKTKDGAMFAYLAPCLYFSQPGAQNTCLTLEAATRRGRELKLKLSQAVVASSSGRTGVLATEYLAGLVLG